MLRKPPRVRAVLLLLCFAVSIGEALALHECPMHDGPVRATDAPAHAVALDDTTAGHVHSEPVSRQQGERDDHGEHGACTCVGQCSITAGSAGLPGTRVVLAMAAPHEAAADLPPADAPPLFIALAADDPFFANSGYGLVDSWKAAKRPVEFHLYEQGGHGFGMYPKETTSTGWFDAFVRWIGMHGMLKPAASAAGAAAN